MVFFRSLALCFCVGFILIQSPFCKAASIHLTAELPFFSQEALDSASPDELARCALYFKLMQEKIREFDREIKESYATDGLDLEILYKVDVVIPNVSDDELKRAVEQHSNVWDFRLLENEFKIVRSSASWVESLFIFAKEHSFSISSVSFAGYDRGTRPNTKSFGSAKVEVSTESEANRMRSALASHDGMFQWIHLDISVKKQELCKLSL